VGEIRVPDHMNYLLYDTCAAPFTAVWKTSISSTLPKTATYVGKIAERATSVRD
jgi:hypothetical protein